MTSFLFFCAVPLQRVSRDSVTIISAFVITNLVGPRHGSNLIYVKCKHFAQVGVLSLACARDWHTLYVAHALCRLNIRKCVFFNISIVCHSANKRGKQPTIALFIPF